MAVPRYLQVLATDVWPYVAQEELVKLRTITIDDVQLRAFACCKLPSSGQATGFPLCEQQEKPILADADSLANETVTAAPSCADSRVLHPHSFQPE